MMIDMLLLALAAKAGAGYQPPPETFYHQAVGCVASALAAKGVKDIKDAKSMEPTGDEFGEMMTWGMILAEQGQKLGRSHAQVDSGDIETALPFYRYLKAKKPPAFAAHRAYCSALLDADRP